MVLKLQKKVESSILVFLGFFVSTWCVLSVTSKCQRPRSSRTSQVIVQVMKLLFDVTQPGGSVLITRGPRGHISLLSPRLTHAALSLLRGRKWWGEEKRECSYIMANALCPCAVSAGRWCIAQHSRANGQMKQGRAGDGKCVEKHGMRPLVTSTWRSG